MFPSLRSLLLTASLLFVSNFQATAHGIAGNRLFIGTLAFDDPAVADELVLPLISNTTSEIGRAHV